jgi:hypothetical protein
MKAQKEWLAMAAEDTSKNHALDWEQTSAVDPYPTWRPTSEGFETSASHRQLNDIPPQGYPISEEAVVSWFKKTYKRAPAEPEIGVILDAMARRDAEQPATEPPTQKVFLDR